MGKLYCVVCGEEKPITKCCNQEEMKSNGSYLVCGYCGTLEYFPMHCSKLMKVR
ncbi:hypothetical protein HY989_05545 [Candidatus Micrarchaeota archaeon]|nr:hypothetical protein [Candidatus Micrarchaeota archaeon]